MCALQNQDPGQWNDLEAFFDTFLFKSNLHLFVDVVEDVANSRESRSTIGIKHRWSYNLRKRFVFSVKMILVLFFNIMYVLHSLMHCCTHHVSVLYPIRKALCQQKVPLKPSHLKYV